MVGSFKRYDMNRPVRRQMAVLKPITWLVSFPKAWSHKSKIDKTNVPKDLKPPFFLLCNHNSFMDFMIMTKAIFPYRGNYVIAIDGFIKLDWLLRSIGGICNRKFVRSTRLVKAMLQSKEIGDVIGLFPEARYSLCGTQSKLPESLGKMIKKLNMPVVTLIMHGHHINAPFWNIKNRKIKNIEAEMSLLLTQQDTQELNIDVINKKLEEAFIYDDYQWQKDNKVVVKSKSRAEGLHKVLYQCPNCNTEYMITSSGSTLTCHHCNKSWNMSEYGELSAVDGITEFSHIPDWYEWERSNVRKEVESGTYSFETEVRIESLPNAKGFVVFKDTGKLTHNMEGFRLDGICEDEPFTVEWSSKSQYSCHIEYNYMKRGDCVDLSTPNDTFYIFPLCEYFSITKIALATEEMYRYFNKD